MYNFKISNEQKMFATQKEIIIINTMV